MRRKSLGVLVSFALVLAACGAEDSGGEWGPGDPVLQIKSEGSLMPMELAMNTGPAYTVLGDGRLVFMGVQTLQFPGPLIPPYMAARFTESQMDAVLAMVGRMGLPEITDETDDSAANLIADASTEIITYWDEEGAHRYAVFALGFEEEPSDRNETFLELVQTLSDFALQAPAVSYEPETVRIVAGPGTIDPQFSDTRPWPLPDDDLEQWSQLDNGWYCRDFDASVVDAMGDANSATTWEHPDGMSDPMTFLVRPVLPGEEGCPA
jgi:hypothetical protein